MDKNYTQDIAKSTLWTTGSFIITSIIGFSSSIILVRYLGINQYGVYGYFMWVVATFSILANPGIGQAILKYFPEYYFSRNSNQKILWKKLLNYFLAAQVIVMIILLSLMFINSGIVSKYLIRFQYQEQDKLLIYALIALIPVILNNFLLNVLRAIQKFKILSILQIISQIIWLGGILYILKTHASLYTLIIFYIFINLFSLVTSAWCLRSIYRQNITPPQNIESLPLKKIIRYSTWGFINLFLVSIVWDKSELFFLGMYSNNQQIAIYSLAYSLSIYILSLFSPLMTVINNTTAELIGTKQQNKLHYLSQHLTKYLGIIIIPISILFIVYINKIILLFYGQDFLSAGIIFPFLIFSQIIPVVFNPISTIPTLSNDIRKMVYIGFAAAILNITLDLCLIPSLQALGAAIANSTAQLLAISLGFVLIRKYKLHFFTKYFIRVLLINFLFFLTLVIINLLFHQLILQIIFDILLIILYVKFILRYSLNQRDYDIFINLQQITPKYLKPVIRIFLNKMHY
ncbi:MAG: oligosaccharide flippase family protein [Patescibacteria group bacterium]